MKSEITEAQLHSPKTKTGASGAGATRSRRYPIGAELIAPEQVSFRVWAPKAQRLEVVFADGHSHFLEAETAGYFSGTFPGDAGARYQFRVDDSSKLYPDPMSRFQPDGPHGPSAVVDPFAFSWQDSAWKGRLLKGQVIYEMHIGTFTQEGTWRAAAAQLAELARIGVTVIEMMPVADFPGKFGWGYDGVDLFAPCRLYGQPDDLRSFVDRAHSLGLAIILDVVYNHFGPDGNYLRVFSDDYFTAKYENDWGDSINFDGPGSGPVREFYLTNSRYWIEEFHFDGFRFDATQDIKDASKTYLLGEIAETARSAARDRAIILVAENEPQETKIVRPASEGGDGLDGLWNDDFHHSAVVALTGRNEAYYSDYRGCPQEFVSAAKYGYLFQGQHYSWQEACRGMPSFGVPPEAFVNFIENHDQLSNYGRGDRLRFQTSPGRYRALAGLLLLGPWTPMLFQGQEFGASSPFAYFTDVGDETLKKQIWRGRVSFLQQFPSMRSKDMRKIVPVPYDPQTFAECKIDLGEREINRTLYDLYIDLLALRRDDSRFSHHEPGGLDGAVLNACAFVLRFFDHKNDDRLLIINLGAREDFTPAPEPLLAAPLGFEWEVLWSSESPKYGGAGEVPVVTETGWSLPAEATVALRLVPEKKPRAKAKRRKLPEPEDD